MNDSLHQGDKDALRAIVEAGRMSDQPRAALARVKDKS